MRFAGSYAVSYAPATGENRSACVAMANGGFGRVPPLRSGPGCARRRARYNCAQRRRAPGAPGFLPFPPPRAWRAGVSPLRARIPHATATRDAAPVPAVETAAATAQNPPPRTAAVVTRRRRATCAFATACVAESYAEAHSNFSPFSRDSGGEGPGERGTRGRQMDARRRGRIRRHPNLPPQFCGRWASNASPEGAACPSHGSLLPRRDTPLDL
jgi:hypothetical protein